MAKCLKKKRDMEAYLHAANYCPAVAAMAATASMVTKRRLWRGEARSLDVWNQSIRFPPPPPPDCTWYRSIFSKKRKAKILAFFWKHERRLNHTQKNPTLKHISIKNVKVSCLIWTLQGLKRNKNTMSSLYAFHCTDDHRISTRCLYESVMQSQRESKVLRVKKKKKKYKHQVETKESD